VRPTREIFNSDTWLTFEDGEVCLNGELLPGILVCIDVNAGVRFDKAERDSMSGKAKIPMGWDDTQVRITMDLLCDYVEIEGGHRSYTSCYDKLYIINDHFKSVESGQKPQPKIYNITNRHLHSRGVTRMIFYGLESHETDQEDVIQVVMTFVEHVPAVVKREKQAIASKRTAPPAVKSQPAVSPGIMQDPSPFTDGFVKAFKQP
jgi:hypothetical protein